MKDIQKLILDRREELHKQLVDLSNLLIEKRCLTETEYQIFDSKVVLIDRELETLHRLLFIIDGFNHDIQRDDEQ